MKSLFKHALSAAALLAATGGMAQNSYQYSVDLNAISNDQVSVSLVTPKLTTPTATFSFPKIIPGTYAISDYGKFISNVKAFDKNGKALTVTKLNDNQWKIANATSLAKVTYTVDDVYDTDIKHGIYPMAATNIEEGKNLVVHPPGVFGFFEGLTKLPFEVNISKPKELYASTSLSPVASTPTSDAFRVDNVDQLYDAPIMYTVPDTATVMVGNCKVLVSVYSPNKKIHAKQIAEWMSDLLDATRQYLGGKLPADKYAFLYYYKDPTLKHSFPMGLGGALEHNTSSFYYLYEVPQQMQKESVVDISSHEFFHIVTPLTISSKEVKEFNWNKAVLSKHLWLYEGVTEYSSHHVLVKYGLNTVQQFLNKLSGKITDSRTHYNDSLAFTELSLHAADTYEREYGNVYQKGALIGAALDVYLLHLSKGNYGLRNLTYDLGVRYGRNRYFNDDELFAAIEELTYPEVRTFLEKYVAGPTPIPYEYYFGLAGVKYSPRAERQVFSLGGIALLPTAAGRISVGKGSQINEFGKKMGYQVGDEIYAINGMPLTMQNVGEVVANVKKVMKEGDQLTVMVGRKNDSNTIDTLTLSAPISKVIEVELNKLELMPNPTPQQQLVQKAWLTAPQTALAVAPTANPADVASIDAIIKAMYDVISGAAGPRNWDRFHSLFLPEAKMGAITAAGQYRTFTPVQYQRNNKPHFDESGFYEEELKRNVLEYGNVANVQTSYQFRFEPNGPVQQRGVNYVTLVKTNGRWWIANLSWQPETKDLPMPASLEKSAAPASTEPAAEKDKKAKRKA
jgi:predicted metalloprotease with PDZ domain